MIRDILKLGNPKLYKISEEIKKDEIDDIKRIVNDLRDTLLNFREEYKCGRAIASPQIGEFKRLIYMNIENTCSIFIIFKIYQCAEILKKSACIMKMVLRMKKIYEKICH